MNLSDYVSKRILMDTCDVNTRINDEQEGVYNKLTLLLDQYTARFGHLLIPKLYINTSDEDKLIKHVSTIYHGILSSDKNKDTENILRTIFFATYYLMRLYKNNVFLASYIALYFVEVTRSFDSWKYFKNEYDKGI
jgi:hypothetical protein